jgi:hypothetical protein
MDAAARDLGAVSMSFPLPIVQLGRRFAASFTGRK